MRSSNPTRDRLRERQSQLNITRHKTTKRERLNRFAKKLKRANFRNTKTILDDI